MAEEEKKNKSEGKYSWLLIKGCCKSPRSVEEVKRRGTNGADLGGMKYDFQKMQEMIEQNKDYELYNVIQNMRSLKCEQVMKEIKDFASFAEKNECIGIQIYFTGNGERTTGNWCFSDGVISLKQVLNAINSTGLGKKDIIINCDASYSGQWVLDLHEYKNTRREILIRAASFPGNVAYDTPKGGMFTAYLSESDEEISNELYWCKGYVDGDDDLQIKLYRGKIKIE